MKLSVCIAVYNEEKTIAEVIKLWAKEPVDEIVIASSGSTDATDNILKEIAAKNKKVRAYFQKARMGKAGAINLLFKKAKGGILIMTDGDVFPEEGCTSEILREFENKNVGVVAGRPVVGKSRGMQNYWASLGFAALHQKRLQDIGINVTGNLYGLKKGVIKKIPEGIILDDAYIALRAKVAGYAIKYAPGARVLVAPPLSVSDFLLQKIRTRTGWHQLKTYGARKKERSASSDFMHAAKVLRQFPTLQSAVYLLLLVLFSAIAWLIAWVNWKTRRISNKWKRIESAK